MGILISTVDEDEGGEELQHNILLEILSALGLQWSTPSSGADQRLCVRVMFVQADVSEYHGDSAHPPKTLKAGDPISVGARLGIIEGFIRLITQDGRSIVCGLTCHHNTVDGVEPVKASHGEILMSIGNLKE